jgi:L-seryl-tRNA(Ser) seleniumtransferase
VNVINTTAYVGGGSLPHQQMESIALTLASDNASENEIAQRLRTGDSPVVGRVERGVVIIDLRAVLPHQDENLIEALIAGLKTS